MKASPKSGITEIFFKIVASWSGCAFKTSLLWYRRFITCGGLILRSAADDPGFEVTNHVPKQLDAEWYHLLFIKITGPFVTDSDDLLFADVAGIIAAIGPEPGSSGILFPLPVRPADGVTPPVPGKKRRVEDERTETGAGDFRLGDFTD